MINIVTISRIKELSESKSKLDRLKIFISNWKNVALLSIGLMTAKVCAEQIVMAIR